MLVYSIVFTYLGLLLSFGVVGPSSADQNSTAASKKGAGVWSSININTEVEDIGATWAYAWGPAPEEAFTEWSLPVPRKVELVPQVWNLSQANTETLQSIVGKSYTVVLGYNEPDIGTPPANYTDAAAAWPSIVATGLRVGSPAPAHTNLAPNDWFYEFMNAVKAKGSHVDFICLHYYAPEFNDIDLAVSNFQKYMQSVHDFYNLPIWVTEYAMVDYSVLPWRTPDDATQAKYAIAATKMLQGLDFVERFAWFAVPQNDNQPPTNLFDVHGNITVVGEAYKAV